MVDYTRSAISQVRSLQNHYVSLERLDALRSFNRALIEAEGKIELRPQAGLSAPRPYPGLAKPGRAWIKAGRYWIAYTVVPRPVIVAVFFETSDIAGRM